MIKFFKETVFTAIAFLIFSSNFTAHAVQIDWGGQFWFDNHWLNNYQLERGRPGYDSDPTLYNAGGPYVPGQGEKNVTWYSAFFKLKPKLIVNDSIHIKSEWHVGSPIYGFLGRDFPTSAGEQFNFTGSQRGGATISAARFWASLITDFGTLDIGRAPIHWGLGALWNSGDDLFNRYQSSGDMVRFVGKFGNFYVAPALSKVAIGNNVAGALNTASDFPNKLEPRLGNDDVTDYHIAAKYENTEEDFDFGLMWTRRTGNAAQTSLLFTPSATGSTRLNFNIFDFYAKKKWRRFGLGGEVPLMTGTIGGVDGSANDFEYKTVAAILEGSYNSDSWDVELKGGHVPGQAAADPIMNGSTVTAQIKAETTYKPVYLHRNYGLGLIMFHYNLYGLGANNPDTQSNAQLRSPYDAPIVNANYFALTPTFKLDKWSFFGTIVAAWADETVPNNPNGTNRKKFYNHHRRQWFDAASNNGEQSSFMGWEWNLGARFKWDDHCLVAWTMGMWFPGSYYEYSNLPNSRVELDSFLFASQFQIGINF